MEYSYLKSFVQPLRKLGHHQTHLFLLGHISLAFPQKDSPLLDELWHPLPVYFAPFLVVCRGAFLGPRGCEQLFSQLSLLGLSYLFPLQIQALHKLLPFFEIIILVPQPEEHCLQARESSPQVFCGGECEAQDKV